MATMAAVSTSAAATTSSSMRLLPAFDGLRAQAHSTVKCALAPAQTSSVQSTEVIRVIRCSKAEGPLRRPSLNAPPAAPSTLPPPPSPPSPPPAAPAVELPPAPSVSASSSVGSGVTIEFQRQRAKEMQEYFLDKKFEEETSQSRIFGWTRRNEIANGRWVMFGLAVGLLTEYATGSDFVDQLKIVVSNLGIAEVD